MQSDWPHHPKAETKADPNDAPSNGGTEISLDHKICWSKNENNLAYTKASKNTKVAATNGWSGTCYTKQRCSKQLQRTNNTRNKEQLTSRNHNYKQMGFIEIHNQKCSRISSWLQEERKLQIIKWSRNKKNVKRTKKPETTDREMSEPWADQTT